MKLISKTYNKNKFEIIEEDNYKMKLLINNEVICEFDSDDVIEYGDLDDTSYIKSMVPDYINELFPELDMFYNDVNYFIQRWQW
jgi:hypothetical protein